MATSDILIIPATKATFTCTLLNMATATSRQSTMVNNSSNYPAAIITMKIKSGSVAPTAGTTYDIFLLRGDDPASSTYRTDGAGASDAAITIENALLIGSIVVTATAAKVFYGDFDTAPLGPLGPEWGIAVRNNTGQNLDNVSEANFLKGYVYYRPQAQ